MQVAFLGGANGVGASCVAIEIAGRWVVIDAGIRMGPGVDRLPDLSFLEHKDVAAVLVTHAHADHIAALPLVHAAFPQAPIYTSRATRQLMSVMLHDALTIMEKRAADAWEVPLYSEQMVVDMLRHVRPLPINVPCLLPALPGVAVCAARAGHVAGAVSIGLTAADGSVICSGDVSLTPQRTVLPAALPQLRSPDLLILESTYGGRLHANRQVEEARLVAAVSRTIAAGGHVLIPAFALGRAQEILLLLRDAQHQGTIPAFPVWADGLVRTVCAEYTQFSEALPPLLQAQLSRGDDLFFGGSIQPISSPHQRRDVVRGPPACIIASSGMLHAGPAAFYATQLLGRPNAAIYLSGYLDDESPGRRMLAAAQQGGGRIEIAGHSHVVRCTMAPYALSAHADGGELAALVDALQPGLVALVHGDDPARAALANELRRRGHVVEVPHDGNVLEVTAQHAQPSLPYTLPLHRRSSTLGSDPIALVDVELFVHDGAAPPASVSRRDDAQSLDELVALLRSLLPPTLTMRDVPCFQHGSGVIAVRCAGRATHEQVLSAVDQFRRRTGWQVCVDLVDSAQPLDARAACAVARRVFADVAVAIRRHPQRDTTLVLAFAEADLARTRYAEQVRRVAEQTCWTVVVEAQEGETALVGALPPQLRLASAPTVVRHARQVVVQSQTPLKPHVRQQYVEQFARATGGWQLHVHGPRPRTRAG